MIEECYQQLSMASTAVWHHAQLTKLLVSVFYSVSVCSAILGLYLSSLESSCQKLKPTAKLWGASTGKAALIGPKTSKRSQNGAILKRFGC